MRTIYIGGSSQKSKGSFKWKLYFSFFIFLFVTGSILKMAAPTIVEKWINKNGSGKHGYAFSIRDVNLSLSKGEITLNDVKVFAPKTNTEILEAPKLTLRLDITDILQSREKKFSVSADLVEIIISKEFSSEMARIKDFDPSEAFQVDGMEAKIGQLNFIEQKEDQSRTVIELKDVDIKAKDFNLISVNKKTEFSLSSGITDGGKLKLTGKTTEAGSWSVQGSLKDVPAELLNKIAGDKLPFAFIEPKLNAGITAQSDRGVLVGEITPEVRKLNLVEERPGIPTQTIARLLTDELTFSLPFSMKDDLRFQYSETFARLKNYRKYAGTTEQAGHPAISVPQIEKPKKSSFWPF